MAKDNVSKRLRQVEVRKMLESGKTQQKISNVLNFSLKTINIDCQEISLEIKKEKKKAIALKMKRRSSK